ncbi:MAG: phosphotransferase [Actinomycetota bacterium]
MRDRLWPAAVDDLLDGPQSAVEVIGPDRRQVGDRQVLRLEDSPESDESNESDESAASADPIAAYRSLLSRLAPAAPFAMPTPVGDHGPWLVLEIPTGVPADRPDRHPEPANLATRVGEALAVLHGLSTDLAGDEGAAGSASADPWAPIVARCRRAVAADLVDTTELPAPYDRYRPEELLRLLVEGVDAAGPPADGPVLCHGRPQLGRFLVDGDRFVGFDGLETVLVADRHLDLATAHLSVAEVLGAEAVYAFYEGYGADPDLARLDRAILAHHLLTVQPRTPSADRG